MTNDGKKNLAKILAEVMQEAGYVQKSSKNDFHGYSYASAEAVQTKFREALAKRGVVVSRFEITALRDEPGYCRLIGKLYLTDGESEIGPFTGIGEGRDKGDKAAMKAWTAANKYAVAAAILLSWGNDPEADSSVDVEAYLDQIAAASTPKDLDAVAKELAKLTSGKSKLKKADVARLQKAYLARKELVGAE